MNGSCELIPVVICHGIKFWTTSLAFERQKMGKPRAGVD